MFETHPSTTLKPSKKPQQKYNWKQLALVAIGTTFLLLVVLGFALDAFSESSNHLAKRIDTLQKENDRLVLSNELALERVNYYKVNKEYLKSIGATDNQADLVLKASTVHNIDPKLLGALIASESAFKNTNHSLKCVVGVAGINTQCGSVLLYDPHMEAGNIMNAAKLLKDYKMLYGTNLKAVARYKGYSKKGFRQAENVMKIYHNML